MPSKRCETSAKTSENCSSTPVTNRMACQSRCEIRVQASRRRLSSTFSRPSTPRSLAVWGWACRSAGQLSKPITDDCGRARTCPARSEEHTSELQSRLHLVCRLLLEKKKKQKQSSLQTKNNTETQKT